MKATLLYALIQKNRDFKWEDSCRSSFNQLKDDLCSDAVLKYRIFEATCPFLLDTAASDLGLGAVLSQMQGDKEQVISYNSGTLTKPEKH